MKNFAKIAVVAVAISAAAMTQAVATALAPGGNVVPGADVLPGGAPIATLVDAFSSSLFSGVVETRVYSDAVYNPGGLTFVYQVRVDANAPGNALEDVRRFSDFSWDAFASDVYQTAAGVQAATADRTADGSTIGWNFLEGLFNEGDNSAFLIIRTDAPNYQDGIGAVIDGASANMDIYVPARAVPDGGATLILLGMATVGLGALRRKLVKS